MVLSLSMFAPSKSVQAAPGQQPISSFLATMQGSVENLCNNFRTYDPRDNDSSKIVNGAIEGGLKCHFSLLALLKVLGVLHLHGFRPHCY